MAAMPQVELILAVGQYAQAFHLGERRHKTMTETVRDWCSYFHSNSGPAIFALPHPSWRNTGWLKKNPWFTEELLPVLRRHVEMRLS